MNERAKSRRLRWAGPLFVVAVIFVWIFKPLGDGLRSLLFHNALQTIKPYAFYADHGSFAEEVSPDGRYVIATDEHHVTFWDPFSRKAVARFEIDTPLHFAHFLNNGKAVLIQSANTYRSIEVDTWKMRDTLVSFNTGVNPASTDDPLILDGAEDITALLHDLSMRQKEALWKSQSVKMLSYDRIRNRMVLFDRDSNRIQFHLNNRLCSFKVESTPRSVVVSADDRTAAWFENHGCVIQRLQSNQRQELPIRGHVLAISDDSSKIAVGLAQEIVIYSVESLKPLCKLQSDSTIHRKLTFAGNYLFAFSASTSRVEMWKIPV